MDVLRSSKKYILTHLFYLLSKKNVVFLVVFNLVCSIYLVYISSIFEGIHTIDANRSIYYEHFNNDFFQFTKIVFICFIIFMSISFFGREYNLYSNLLIKDKRTKAIFYITKYISFLLISLLELLFISISYYSLLAILPYGKFYISSIGTFLRLLFLGSFYLFFTSFLLSLFNTHLAGIISLISYWFSFIYSSFYGSLSKGEKILLLIFPFGEGKSITFLYGTLHVIIYTIILILLNVLLIIVRDEA